VDDPDQEQPERPAAVEANAVRASALQSLELEREAEAEQE
jgi:hypothetical protein